MADFAALNTNLAAAIAPALSHMQAETLMGPALMERMATALAPALSRMQTEVRMSPALMERMGAAIVPALSRMQADIHMGPTLSERMATALAPALSRMQATVDLSNMNSALQQIAETQELARQPWFTEQVQALYASDVLDQLDEQTPTDTDPTPLSPEEAAELDALALAFQQNPLLTDAQAKRLFQAYLLVLILVLWTYASVSLDGPLEETIGNAADIAGAATTAVVLTTGVWKRRSPRSEDERPAAPESS